MGSDRRDNRPCDHYWRRAKKQELEPHDNPKHYIACRACGAVKQVPFDMIEYYDLYFPSFPEDDEDQ